MNIELTIKNYRCFPDEKPVRLVLANGFTALLGINNSGKSSLLKFFYEFRSLFNTFASPLGNHGAALQGTAQDFALTGVFDIAEVFSNANSRDIELQLDLSDLPKSEGDFQVVDRMVLRIPRGTTKYLLELYVQGKHQELKSQTSFSYSGKGLMDARAGGKQFRLTLQYCLDACRVLSKAMYIGPFRNAINAGGNDRYFDIKTGTHFIEDWRNFVAGDDKARNQAAYDIVREIKRIFGLDDLHIQPAASGHTLQIYLNGKSYKLTELGSGLTQFIIVLANAAVATPTFILIDEPELNLHPSLQLDFLTTLASYASHGVLFATQNIGLARASANRIYSIRKSEHGLSEVCAYEAVPRLSEFLGELSFAGYRELGFDNVLLVEGPKDITTVQQFLRLYKKDHKIVVLHLGGRSTINGVSANQLEEIKRITENVSALIDSERTSKDEALHKDRIAFGRLCEDAKIKCHVLERRAMENYLSGRALKEVKGEKYRALEPYESLSDAPMSWGKEENWRIAQKMSLEEISSTDLGMFLNEL